MRVLLIILLGFIVGCGLWVISQIDPDNYVKMYISGYVVEISVVWFLCLLFIASAVLYCVIRLCRLIIKSGSLFSVWRDKKTTSTAQAALGAGYLLSIKGDWSRAEKSLTTKVSHSGLPYVNYLAAAQAAQEQGKLVARDEYLNAAYKIAPQERFAIGLIKARLHQKAGQLDQALATLQDIAKDGAKNAQYTAMLLQTYQQMGNWSGVQSLLSLARKQKALPKEVLDQMYHDAHFSVLRTATDKKNAWAKLPRDEKKHAQNVALYAQSLLKDDENSEAEKLIRSALKNGYDDTLVAIYGSINSDNPSKLRRNVEGWLMARPESAELNLAAGRFAIAEKDIELAKEYLHKSITHGQLPLAYSLLGQVYENSSDSGKALALYRAGIASVSTSASVLIESDDSAKSGALIGDLISSKNKF